MLFEIFSVVFALSRQINKQKYAKTFNILCASNKDFVKYQAQGGGVNPTLEVETSDIDETYFQPGNKRNMEITITAEVATLSTAVTKLLIEHRVARAVPSPRGISRHTTPSPPKLKCETLNQWSFCQY